MSDGIFNIVYYGYTIDVRVVSFSDILVILLVVPRTYNTIKQRENRVISFKLGSKVN